MTETTPTLMAARDALAKAIRAAEMVPYSDGDGHLLWRAATPGEMADALLATVVRDVATLTADEALVERITSALCDKWPGGAGLTEYTRLALTALAAALGGDQ